MCVYCKLSSVLSRFILQYQTASCVFVAHMILLMYVDTCGVFNGNYYICLFVYMSKSIILMSLKLCVSLCP